jgi:chromosomal replication initiator protein
MAHATMCNREIDMELAQYVISRSVKRAPKALTVELIVETVCNYYNVSQTDVQTKNRKRDVVNARQVAMFLSDKYTDASSGKIGQLIGGRDHATVLHAYKVVKQQMEVDKSFRSTVDAIEKSLMM